MSYHSSSGRSASSRRSSRRTSVTSPRSSSANRSTALSASGRSKKNSPNRLQMNTVKSNRGGQLKISSRTQEVQAPEGFHWMQENGRYYLMKGEYKSHAGASRTAKFKLVNHG